MADEGDDPRKSKTDFDRMSLNSLKREMEVQKAKTEAVREAAKERRAEQEKEKRAFPWAMVVGILIVGVGGFFGIVYALRESFPAVAHSVLPIFMYSPPDTGPPRPDAWVAPNDAGTDAYVAPTVHHHPPHTGTGSTPGGDLGLGDLGDGEADPIGGVGE